ncbi:MAG: hypothetical protein PHH09_01465 [Methanoregulaceae archaeon]|nr:hypothetical protein [Methanoregulaceae archaeon]MDD5047579.1 hypothetical protein [Methanoregulaceae archaeon]
MTDDELCRDAVERWGEDDQMIVAVEELSELVHALTKLCRGNTPDRAASIAEEIADVELVLKQVVFIMERHHHEWFSLYLDLVRTHKRERLQGRIERSVREHAEM